jgi:Na+/H+ antiporter NhaC
METAKVITPDYIRNFFHLGAAKDAVLVDFIMSRLVLKEYTHNRYVCRAGDSADAMYFIESGTIIVRGANNEVINELEAGRYFGEYAALTGDKRMADIQARGTVRVYALDKKILRSLSQKHAGIYSLFLKNAYDQAAERYRKLVKLLNLKRGINYSGVKKRLTLPRLFINYYIVFVILLAALLFSPPLDQIHPVWLCSPIVFMVAYIVLTKRALEALVISSLYIMILLDKLGFVGAFYEHILVTITGTSDILLMVVLMGSLTRLFSASGSINALKNIAQRKIKSAKGIMFAAFVSMICIAIDEYLSILINGACFTPLADEKRIPREKSAMVMGMAPGALCILSPLSLTGIYLSGLIAISSGQRDLFFYTIRYNFAAIATIALIFLLVVEKLPLARDLRKARKRVRWGGPLWPAGTEDFQGEEEATHQGRMINLLLPVLVLIASSVIAGTLEAGGFHVNVLYGMCITLIFAFFLYCFQQYMTPEQFFKNIVFGIESMIGPVALFLMGKCFANGMEEIGFSAWLNTLALKVIHGQLWLLPLIIFSVCTIVGALFDNPWAMYAIGMPVAVSLANSMDGNMALYVGAVCAAGLMGNEIALGDIFFIGPMLGINPMRYYRAKLPYVIFITILTFAAFGAAGWFKL